MIPGQEEGIKISDHDKKDLLKIAKDHEKTIQ